MGTIKVKYTSKKQLSTLKKVLSALDFEFSEEEFKNPSPSGDKWFENPKNLEMIDIGISDLKSGKKTVLTKELQKELLGL
ncbi:hypothetical protein SAMN05660493_01125 [Epilithonimonas bovis DSM 19482]|uniref:Uncharacterized protein n=1 Tax=Epilithonimonas bovis DSM 19482 TaxID=1121284 RepID=A0A1U7PSA0_9FLAO|nr:hypothetical protein [Epilithonimonas bovis]SIT96445.1 hypothetical protein SAMN05660493_01125 [Epilithonimonas bovis DSM 19482]